MSLRRLCKKNGFPTGSAACKCRLLRDFDVHAPLPPIPAIPAIPEKDLRRCNKVGYTVI